MYQEVSAGRRSEWARKLHSSKAAKAYTDRHWGQKPRKVYTSSDPRLPDELTMMGELEEFNVVWKQPAHELPEDDPGDATITFPGKGNLLCFAVTKDERLYPVLDAATVRDVRSSLWLKGGPVYNIGEVARNVGGRQARFKYPRIEVQVFGYVLDVVYRTHKTGDGFSTYIHRFGEYAESTGELAALCVCRDGTLWLAGGAYETGVDGIGG